MADVSDSLEEFKETAKKQGEELLLKHIPEKIVSLNTLLGTTDWKNTNASHLLQSINIPIPESSSHNADNNHVSRKRKNLVLTDGEEMGSLNNVVPSNQKIVRLVNIVKPKIQQLLEDSNILKMWISYMIPKIEDGNNFGVSVQEETLTEIQTVESEAAAFFEQISRYHHTRGKLITKVSKYPHVEDYRCAVNELDEKQFLSLWLVLREIRNRYSTLHDIVVKNLDKIKKPRSSHTEALY